MNRNLLIASRLREVFLNGHWIAATNYREQIADLDWALAIQEIEGLNTIAALTYHVNYYLDGLLNAFETGTLLISDKLSFNMPAIRSATDWKTLVNEFLQNAERFCNKVAAMEDHRFDQPFIDPKYGTFLRNIEGVIEHSYYHLGQVVLIRKMLLHQRS